jgi:hypothetical protein
MGFRVKLPVIAALSGKGNTLVAIKLIKIYFRILQRRKWSCAVVSFCMMGSGILITT